MLLGLLLLGKPTHTYVVVVVEGIMNSGGGTRCILAPRSPQLGSSQVSGPREETGGDLPIPCVERSMIPACPGVEGESECGPLVIFLNRILNQFVIDDCSTDRNPKPGSVSSCAVSISCQVCHFFPK